MVTGIKSKQGAATELPSYNYPVVNVPELRPVTEIMTLVALCKMHGDVVVKSAVGSPSIYDNGANQCVKCSVNGCGTDPKGACILH